MPGLYDNDGRLRTTPGMASGDLSASNPMPTQESPAANGATTTVASSATPVTLKAANANRKGLVVNNDSTSILYVLLGSGTVSATNFTYALAAKGTVPSNLIINGFSGLVTGVWSAANGSAYVTELT